MIELLNPILYPSLFLVFFVAHVLRSPTSSLGSLDSPLHLQHPLQIESAGLEGHRAFLNERVLNRGENNRSLEVYGVGLGLGCGI